MRGRSGVIYDGSPNETDEEEYSWCLTRWWGRKIGVRYASGDGFVNGKELPWSIAPAASLLSSKPVWPSWHIKEKNTKSNLFHHIFLRQRTSWQKTIGQAYAEVLTHANSRHSFRPAIGS